MKTTKTILMAAALPALMALSACGGGGSGGPDRNDSRFEPVAGVTMDVVTNTTGVAVNTETPFDAAVGNSSYTDMNGAARQMLATITFNSGTNDGRDQGIQTSWDASGNGAIERFPQTNVIDSNLRANFNPTDTTRVLSNGQPAFSISNDGQIVRAVSRDSNIEDIVYVPASTAAQTYGGMYVNKQEGVGIGRIFVGVFGRNATEAELTELRNQAILNPANGTATYEGVAHSHVLTTSTTGSGTSAFHEGTATGAVDFGTNAITANTTLGGGATVAISGTYGNTGAITGTTTYTNVFAPGTVTGDARGQIYGPRADTIGLTHSGNTGTIGNSGSIAGGMLLQRTDDR